MYLVKYFIPTMVVERKCGVRISATETPVSIPLWYYVAVARYPHV